MAESEEFYQDEETDHLDPNIRAELRKSKERAKDAAEARAELESLKRELAFTKAGIPETGIGALLRKAYDGDTDTDAIRKAAEEYGILGNEDQVHDPVRDELETHRVIQGATGTNQSGPTVYQAIQAAIDEAGSVDAVMEIVSKQGAGGGIFTTGSQ